MSEHLLLVAVRTDQPNIKRRMETILAAAHPFQERPDTEAQVFARDVSELTANDFERLACFFGRDGVRRLNVGDVVSPAVTACPATQEERR